MRRPALIAVLATATLLAGLPAEAQTDTALTSSFRAFDLPYFTYGSGLGIVSPDSIFKLNFRFRMQNRIGMEIDDGEVGSTQARVRRLRLRLDGFVYSPKLRYTVQLGFATEDIETPLLESPPNLILDAMVTYVVDDHWTLGFGQTKLPGNRERVTSSGDLQLADRSAANAIFNLDRDFGLQAVFVDVLSGKALYIFKGAVSTGEGRNWIASPGMHLCYTIRGELLPFGAFANRGDYYQGDLAREQSPKLSVGVVYSFNNKALRSAGQRGALLYDPRDITTYMADALVKYDGWAFLAEFMRRATSDPVTRDPGAPDDVALVFAGHGLTLQGSYLFPGEYELVARYSRISPDQEIADYVGGHQDYWTAGLTKYLRGHRLKLQLDATYVNELRIGELGSANIWNFRGQIELGI
jgi:phosphate-selective porin OprO/OprP